MMRSGLMATIALSAMLGLGCGQPPTIDEATWKSPDLGKGLKPGFLMGAATAAHQIEGGTDNDWSDWEKGAYEDGSPHIKHSETSADGVRSWGRFETADLPLLETLGANAYRMSVEWSRLEPNRGDWNADAAEQYRSFVIALRQKGIEPMITLHHYTFPKWVSAQGGFENRQTIDDFAAFAARVADLLGDQVDLWCTINEPNVFAFQGYIEGIWPPGKHDPQLAAEVLANLMEAHARATAELRKHDTVDADGDGKAVMSGIAHHLRALQPASSSTMDTTITAISDDFFNETVVRAAKTGRFQVSVPATAQVDRTIEGLAGSFDYLGINYYTRDHVRADLSDPSLSNQYVPDARPKNDLGWDLYPEGLYQFVERFSAYGWPIYITENGIADASGDQRPDYLRKHIAALELATKKGVDIRGYFHWSLMDNFEWAEGYEPRFGLFHVDRSNPEFTREPTKAVDTFRQLAANTRR